MRIVVEVESVSAALDALEKAGVRTLRGGTITGSNSIGIVMIGEADKEKALGVLTLASIKARLG